MQKNNINRVGEIGVNNQGLNMIIIKCINAHNIDIQFDNGYISKNKEYGNFKNGQIKNLYYPSVCGIGFVGEGKYKTRLNGKKTIQYESWQHMLKRCYDEKELSKYPTYIGCEICEELLCFQNFGKWHDENYYTVDGEEMCLDKDILIKGNKIYSPETCIFAPERINILFTKSDSARGEFPIGVCYNKENDNFISRLNKNDEKVYLGSFDTPEEAFYKYKQEKELHIKEIADEYKSKIPQRLYDALYRYEVEIYD